MSYCISIKLKCDQIENQAPLGQGSLGSGLRVLSFLQALTTNGVVVTEKMASKGSGTMRRYGLVEVNAALLEEVCLCGGGF